MIRDRIAATVATDDFHTWLKSAGYKKRRRHPVARVAAKGATRVTQAGGRASWKHRTRLAPIYIGLALMVFALIASRAEKGLNTVLVVAGLVGLAGGWLGRRRGWSRLRWSCVGAAYAAGTTWTLAAVATTVGPPMPGILLGLTILLGVPWWWDHRTREQAATGLDARVATWVEKVSHPQGALPSSYLVDVKPVKTGWSADIQLPGGKLTTEDALNATRRIASAYGTRATSVVVEPQLGGELDQARLLVLDTNPLESIQLFRRPTLDRKTGWLHIGIHADGTPAMWRLYIPGSGCCHGMIAGTTGAGKSGLVNVLCTEIKHSGLCTLWIADGDHGESVPEWTEHVDWFAWDLDEWRRMLQAAERVMNGRKARRSRERWTDDQGREHRGRGKFDPTPEMPQLVILIDESPDILADPECRRIIALIGKKGRKVGVCVIIICQVPSLAELGGDLTIRSMLSSTNIVMFRTSDKLSKQMGLPADLPVNPASLPISWPDGSSTAGLGYIAAAGGRVSPLRAFYQEDTYSWSTSGAVLPLDVASIADAGRDYATWRERWDADEEEAPVHQTTVKPAVGTPASAPSPVVTRDRIVQYLNQVGRAHTSVIAQALGLTKPNTSQTLGRMRDAGQVEQPRVGVWARLGYEEQEAARLAQVVADAEKAIADRPKVAPVDGDDMEVAS